MVLVLVYNLNGTITCNEKLLHFTLEVKDYLYCIDWIRSPSHFQIKLNENLNLHHAREIHLPF